MLARSEGGRRRARPWRSAGRARARPRQGELPDAAGSGRIDDGRRWLALVFLVMGGIAVLDLLAPSYSVFIGLLVVGPFLASAVLSPRVTAATAAVASLLAAALLSRLTSPTDAAFWLRLAGVVLAGGLAVRSAVVRLARERTIVQLRSVVAAAEQAILLPVPSTVGPVRIAARHESAAAETEMGGDLYAVADTRDGARILVGDVRGSGLAAVRTAAIALAAFREAAFLEPSLEGVARSMARATEPHLDAEELITAVLVQPAADEVRLVVLGHPPPLLVTAAGDVEWLEVPSALPLGLQPQPEERVVPWSEGDRLLLYSDGLTEARDAEGRFLRLDRLAAEVLRGVRDPDDALDQVLATLSTHCGGAPEDDLTIVLLERDDGHPRPAQTRT